MDIETLRPLLLYCLAFLKHSFPGSSHLTSFLFYLGWADNSAAWCLYLLLASIAQLTCFRCQNQQWPSDNAGDVSPSSEDFFLLTLSI